MSGFGGFGGFGQANNQQQTSGFGGFGATNTNTNSGRSFPLLLDRLWRPIS
jgi:nuclear pore complex protein Nup98-Nup96